MGMGGDQIGCHTVSDMIAPRNHAYSELISERLGYLVPHYINGSQCETTGSLVKHRWVWLDIGMLSSPHWFELCGALPFALYGSYDWSFLSDLLGGAGKLSWDLDFVLMGWCIA
jgi:hypothetical protein